VVQKQQVVASVKGLILAGGYGTRLYPTTKVVNKHLLLVYNKPLIMYAIETLRDAGVTDIVLSLSYRNPEQFVTLLGDGAEFGVNLTYIIHGEPLGISYAIDHAHTVLGDEPFVCFLGDNIFSSDLKPYINKFNGDSVDAMILLKEVNLEEAKRYGVACFNGDKLVGLEEKPATPKSNFIVVGAYFLTHKFFDVYSKLNRSARGEYEITDAINLLLPNVKYEVYDGEWFDCGTFDNMLEASKHFKNGEVK